MKNPFHWPKVLPWIQSVLNNTFFSIIEKIPNEIAYSFPPKRPLDLILVLDMLNIFVACTNNANVILFALFNQKKYYDRKHQPLFIKVGD